VSPLASTRFVDLDLDRLRALGARHAVIVVRGHRRRAVERLSCTFAGLAPRPHDGEPFDLLAAEPRFELHGSAPIAVPLALDLEARQLRWLDASIAGPDELRHAGGYRAALAHIGGDLAELAGTAARPTLWDVAAIHAAARANIVYVRERSGAISTYRRRDKEQTLARLARLHAGDDPDGMLAELPTANAPTWFALLHDDVAVPQGSAGYARDPGPATGGVERLTAGALVAELAR